VTAEKEKKDAEAKKLLEKVLQERREKSNGHQPTKK
jgi:hypothetical protein